MAFLSAAVIANAMAHADEEKASEIIKLWPKDVARQDDEGMGTLRPDRGDGHIRLTDVTQPSLRYFPAPGQKELWRLLKNPEPKNLADFRVGKQRLRRIE